MSDKTVSQDPFQPTLSEKNAAGTSRRRLVQAMGLLGASGIVSLNWQKPVVSLAD